jgi:hypothetical protein
MLEKESSLDFRALWKCTIGSELPKDLEKDIDLLDDMLIETTNDLVEAGNPK